MIPGEGKVVGGVLDAGPGLTPPGKLRFCNRNPGFFLKPVCGFGAVLSVTLDAMKNALKLISLAVVLALPVASAQTSTEQSSTNPAGTTGSGTPLVEDHNNPSNRAPGTDWGWLGLAGLLGLGGLAGRRYVETQTVAHTQTTGTTVVNDVNRR